MVFFDFIFRKSVKYVVSMSALFAFMLFLLCGSAFAQQGADSSRLIKDTPVTSSDSQALSEDDPVITKSRTRRLPDGSGKTPPYIKIKSANNGTLIQWASLEDSNRYCVYRRIGLYEPWQLLVQTGETSFLDESRQKGLTYYYMVEAYHVEEEPAEERFVEKSFTEDQTAEDHHITKYALRLEDDDAIKVEEPCKVLMIGNSMTAYYGNSAVADLRQMAALNGDALDITQLLINNAVLYDYAYGAYSGYLANALQGTKYDVIVLQEESWTTCTNSSTYLYYIDCITDVLEAYGQQDARIILYAVNGCTHKWGMSYGNYERNMLVNVTLAAQRIRQRHSFREVLVAKAGELHMQARIATPWMGFLSSDGNHPDWYGFYLSAMRLYSAITQRPLKMAAQDMMPYVDLSNTQLHINREQSSIPVGGSLQLSVSGPKGNTLYWYSYNPDVATVSDTGLVQAVTEGKAVIMAESDSGLQELCIVDVTSAIPR